MKIYKRNGTPPWFVVVMVVVVVVLAVDVEVVTGCGGGGTDDGGAGSKICRLQTQDNNIYCHTFSPTAY